MRLERSVLGSAVLLASVAVLGCTSADAVDRRGEATGGTGTSAGGQSQGVGGQTQSAGGQGVGGVGAAGQSAGGGGETGGASTGAGGAVVTGSGGTGGTQLILDGGSPAGETECDGLDNDNNGIIDDVDVGGDGVCDCLNIATIGRNGKYASDVFSSWLSSRSPRGAVNIADVTLDDSLLRPYQVIVVLSVATNMIGTWHAFTPAESDALARWVQAGGGLMTTTGYGGDKSEIAKTNALLVSLDVAYENVMWPVSGNIQQWAMHPVTTGISKIYTFNGARPEQRPAMVPLAWDPEGDLTLAVRDEGSGRIAMWGDEWIIFDSQWGSGSQQVGLFWLNLLKWLSPPNQCQVPIPIIL